MSFLLLAASEPSKVPFYIAGGVFVAWAVVLAAVGLNLPEFPYNRRGQVAVILVSLVLAGTAIGTAIGTS